MMNLLSRLYQRLLSRPGPYIMAQNRRYAAFEIGEGTYGRPEVSFYDAGATLKIGSYTSIAPGVQILLGGEHHTGWVTTYPFSLLFDEARSLPGYPASKGDVVIGSDVWIGQDALILSGACIGHGAVVAARSVVKGEVAPYSIVAGSPARHVRFRFPEETVRALLEIAWWDWHPAEVKRAWPLLQSPDVGAFVARYSKGGAGRAGAAAPVEELSGGGKEAQAL
jgi:acetyltransferase-like isoleucine patch superfamily enzyme